MKHNATINVLLIEDDPVEAGLIRMALEEEYAGPFHIDWAKNLTEGLESLKSRHSDVVLLDLSLPDSGGMESVKRILLDWPHLPVLLLSDVENEAIVTQCLIGGAQDVFSKRYIDTYWLPRALRYAMGNMIRTDELKQSEAYFREMTDTSPLGIFMSDAKGYCLYTNPAYRQMSGLTNDDAKGNGWRERIHPDDLERVTESWKNAIENRQTFLEEFRFVHPDGHIVWVYVTATGMHDGKKLRGFMQTAADITDRKSTQSELNETQEALYEQREKAEVTLNSISDGVICSNTKGDVIYMNPGAERMTGWQEHEAKGHPLEEVFNIVEPTQAKEATSADKNSLPSQNCLLIRRDGTELPIQKSTSPIHDRNGKTIGTVIVCHDVSETHEMAAKMAHLAQHDFLTDLPNRSLLNDRLTQAISLARRQDKQLAVLFLDLDHFKHINDTLGHAIGDLLLQAVAMRLKSCVRGSDTICRQGGDEFVVLLAEVEDSEDAAQVAAKMLDVFTRSVAVDSHELDVGLSIGISVYPDDGEDPDTLIKHADIAMYHAKENGRNNYQFFTSELNIRAVQRHTLKRSLRRAVDREELMLQYQSKIDLQSGRMTGVEALVRWRHPEQGFMLPAQFIPIAEESGMIGTIGQWVLREACDQVKAWHNAGLPLLPVSVNISPVEFKNKDFLQNVGIILQETGLHPQYLELELTESVLLQNAESTSSILHSLKDMGVQLTIDDFGIGYSNLSYLKHFPIDTLKIDQSFVHDVNDDADDATIVRAILSMAESLKLRTIAEGVETPEHLAFLQALQCNEGQGYYFSRPISSEAFAAVLENGGMAAHDEFMRDSF